MNGSVNEFTDYHLKERIEGQNAKSLFQEVIFGKEREDFTYLSSMAR
jgi:hypothetical protein